MLIIMNVPSLYQLCKAAIDKQLLLQTSYLNEYKVTYPTPFDHLIMMPVMDGYDTHCTVNRKKIKHNEEDICSLTNPPCKAIFHQAKK